MTGINSAYPGYNLQIANTKTFHGSPQFSIIATPPQNLCNQDTFELSTYDNSQQKIKKSGMSTLAQWTIGIGSALAGVLTAGVLLMKHQTSKLTRLYNEKMQFVNLAEKIDFREAKTVEEGVKFAKDVLKIGEVGEGFTLDAINYVNRGLVDVSNANKGKLFMPKKMVFNECKDTTTASVCREVESSDFGLLTINKKYFDTDFLNKQLKNDLYSKNSEQLYKFYENQLVETLRHYGCNITFSKDMTKLLNKYYKNPDSLTINEKRMLLTSLRTSYDNLTGQFKRFPLTTIKQKKSLFEKELNIKIDIDSISKKTTEEQQELLFGWTNALANKNKAISYEMQLFSPNKTIYHEMGHLQDYAKNLKELDLKMWQFPSFKDAYREAKDGKKYTDRIRHLDNRWRGLTYDGYKDLFEKNPKEFKKRYPDLYEFLINQETQQTAGKVSWYAQTSIGEFIAEVYAKMISGEKIPNDVVALYKKYNGPMIG